MTMITAFQVTIGSIINATTNGIVEIQGNNSERMMKRTTTERKQQNDIVADWSATTIDDRFPDKYGDFRALFGIKFLLHTFRMHRVLFGVLCARQ